MSEFVVYDPYQPGPIAPVVQMKKNISVWTGGKWEHFLVEFIEGQPLGSQNVFDMLQIAPIATTIAANAALAKRVITQLRVNLNEMLHLRWRPLEALEGILWEQPNKARFESRALLSRVDWRTGDHDPYYATTSFFIVGVGTDRDMNLEVRNPTGWAYPQARFEFWGYRYVMSSITIPDADKAAMGRGDLDAIKRIMGATTFVVAEGRAA